MWYRIRTFALLLFVAVCFEQAPAQVTSAGSIAGQVVDSSGALVPKAAVVAVQTQTNAQWKTVTDGTGNYVFPNLPIGTFTLIAQKEGFSKEQINTVILNAGDQLRNNFTLKPGAVTDTVQVSSDTINVDTESGNVGDVVTGKAIEALPLVGRNFIELVELAPGVSSDIGSDPGYGSNAGLYASSNGVRNTSNNWTIDGVPNEDVYYGNNAIIPASDALAEFRMDRGNYSAEQGRTAGATINAILKQGSNQFHGTAFEYMRNGAFNANSYFNKLYDSPRANSHRNNWGYTVSGPIKEDKLFFFWSEEWRIIHEPAGTSLALVPTDKQKVGDFSDYASIGVAEPMVTTALAAQSACVGCVAGSPFPNDKIPAGLLSANSLSFLKNYYPAAGEYIEGYNFASSVAGPVTVREELVRLDYDLSDKWKAYAHYIQDQNHLVYPYSLWGANSLPNVAGSTEFEPIQSFGVNLVGTITPNLVNETQFGIFHNIIRISANDTLSRTIGNIDIPYYFPNHTNVDDRIPSLSLLQYAGISSNWPFLNGFFYHKWSDNLSWHKGTHNLKFGLLVIQQGKNENNSNSGTNGAFAWYGTQTGNPLADMLVNFADYYQETETNPMQHLRYWDDEAYAQDQWQPNHHLSLTFGLRYTYYGPEIDENNLNSNFLTGDYQASLAPTVNSDGTLSNIPVSQMSAGAYLPTNGIIAAGVNSPWGNAVFSTTKLNMAPRAGFSYDVFGNGKTAIRGGYGIYYDRTAPYQLGGKSNPPFNSSVTLYNVAVDQPRTGGSIFSSVSLTAFNPKYTNPYNQQCSIGVQQQVHRNTVVTVDYVRTKETHLLYENQLNQNGSQLAVASGTMNVDQARPYLGYGTIGQFTPEASSNYYGLQASLREQLGSVLTLNAAYTYSKVLTDASADNYSPQDSHNLKADRGLAPFDKTNMLIIDYVWSLPSFSNRNALLRGAAGGWQWAGIVNTASGEPITPSLGVWLNSGVFDGYNQRPNLTGKAQDGKGVSDWLNVGAFSVPALGTFGNSGVGVARNPHTTQVDSSIYKDFRLYRQIHTEFRLEASNIFNHAIFNGVDSYYYPGSPTFGHITSTALPRLVQAGLHFAF